MSKGSSFAVNNRCHTTLDSQQARVPFSFLNTVKQLTSVSDQDSHDESVNTDNTSHDNGDNTLHDKVRTEDTHGRKTNTSLGGTIGSTEA